MMKKNLLLLFAALLTAASSFAQETEMADAFKASGKIYVVIAVLSIIFFGIVIYLVSIDRKLSKLEKNIEKQKGEETIKKG